MEILSLQNLEIKEFKRYIEGLGKLGATSYFACRNGFSRSYPLAEIICSRNILSASYLNKSENRICGSNIELAGCVPSDSQLVVACLNPDTPIEMELVDFIRRRNFNKIPLLLVTGSDKDFANWRKNGGTSGN